MKKFKTLINIFFLSLLMLVLPPCYANETVGDKYISFSLESFFNAREDKTDNQIYSPLGVNSCVSALTHMLHGQEKIDLETEIKSSGIGNQQLFCSNNDETNLQFFTTMLTRYSATQDQKNSLNEAQITLGEHILVVDSSQQQIDKRNKFKEQIQELLQQKFKGKQNLDYEELWSSSYDLSLILKIISSLRFEAKWLNGKFNKIGKDKFTSFDNQELTVDYMKNKSTCSLCYDDTSGWKSVRIFYENNYMLDIIVPQTETKYSNKDKTAIITNLLITASNGNVFKNQVKLKMPLFKFQQTSNITDMLENMYPSFKNKDTQLVQECVIKVDEEGTIAEARTTLYVRECYTPSTEFTIDRGFYYILSEIDKTKNTLDSINNIDKIIMIGAVNNPLVEK